MPLAPIQQDGMENAIIEYKNIAIFGEMIYMALIG